MSDDTPLRRYVQQQLADWKREHGDMPMPPQLMPRPTDTDLQRMPTSYEVKVAMEASELAQLYDELDGLNRKITVSPWRDPETLYLKLIWRNRYVDAKGANIVERARGRQEEGVEIRRWRQT
jgi:hypothetical protein